MNRSLALIAAKAVLGGCTVTDDAIASGNVAAADKALIQVAPGTLLIGIHATGPQSDLDRLQVAATAAGFRSQQMDGPEGWQLVIAFPPGSNPSSVQSFIARLRSSEFASLKFRSATAPTP